MANFGHDQNLLKKAGWQSQSPAAGIPTPSRGGRRDGASGDKAEKARGPASPLEEIMRRKGVDEAWNALEDMQKQGVVTDKYTVSRMLMKTVGDARSKLNPTRVYRGMALVDRFIDLQPTDVDEVLFNALLDTCGRLKDLARLEAIVSRMRVLQVTPSPVTLGILVKTYGQAGDLEKVLQVWDEMAVQKEQANSVTYGCMIDACVKCGNLKKAVEIFKTMKEEGKHKNTILYTTLIKGYGLDKDLSSAMGLFREMPREGVPYNTITYNSMLDACVKCGDLAAAEQILREMTGSESSLEPDLITFSTLLKGYCHSGELDKALQVLESIKARGLRSDELVYNTLMDGCVKAGDVNAGLGLFEEMVQLGLKPSAITHSILARLYQRAGYEDGAAEAVNQLYQQHGLERPVGGERSLRRGGSNKWTQRSPGSSPNGQQSPFGSPILPSPTGSPFGMPDLQRQRSDTECSWAGWSGYWDPSAPPTPLAMSPVASPQHAQLQLHAEAMRGFCVPPLPGGYSAESHYSGNSACGGSPMGSPCGSPYGMGQQPTPGFCFPAAQQPQSMGYPQSSIALPPWPISASAMPQQLAATQGPQQVGLISGDAARVNQVMAMNAMQTIPCMPPPQMAGASCTPYGVVGGQFQGEMQRPFVPMGPNAAEFMDCVQLQQQQLQQQQLQQLQMQQQQQQQMAYFDSFGTAPQVQQQHVTAASCPSSAPFGGNGNGMLLS